MFARIYVEDVKQAAYWDLARTLRGKTFLNLLKKLYKEEGNVANETPCQLLKGFSIETSIKRKRRFSKQTNEAFLEQKQKKLLKITRAECIV